MNKRPSNAIFYVITSIIILLASYVVGNLLLQARQDPPFEETIEQEELNHTL